jgi:hypothetical protein
MLIAVLASGCACSQPTPPPNTPPTAQDVYVALVDAGCLAPDDAGASAVGKEHDRADSPAWLNCLFGGGVVDKAKIAACAVPCKH